MYIVQALSFPTPEQKKRYYTKRGYIRRKLIASDLRPRHYLVDNQKPLISFMQNYQTRNRQSYMTARAISGVIAQDVLVKSKNRGIPLNKSIIAVLVNFG